MNNLKVLIIGGSGYIGSALTNYLDQNTDFKVVNIDLNWFSFGNHKFFSDQELDYKRLEKKFIQEFGTVILLAGHSSVGMCANNENSVFKNNVQNFVELTGKLNLYQKFIYASSSSVYGDTEGFEVTESGSEFVPKTYYDLSKHMIDGHIQLSNLNYYGLRFGTVCGKSPNFRTDLMLNKMSITAQKLGKLQVCNKNKYRAILGLNDLKKAFVKILESSKTWPGFYNLASFNSSIGEIADKAARYLNVELEELSDSPTYDFKISTDKFQQVFDFKFDNTVESILEDIGKLSFTDEEVKERERSKQIIYKG